LLGTHQIPRNEISSEEYSHCEDASVIDNSEGPVGTPEDVLVTKRDKFADGTDFSIIVKLDEKLMFVCCVIEFCCPFSST